MTNQTVELTTDMIQNGEHQELYEEYAKKKSRGYMDNHIKCALAGYGYCHDILCDDPVTSVREHVISSDIHYAPICFDGTRVLWEHIANELVENEQPTTPDVLSIYEWFLHLDLEQLNINLSNFNKTQYEKTMTPSQLYLQGSPLWIKAVDWPFSATVIKSTSKQETAKYIETLLNN